MLLTRHRFITHPDTPVSYTALQQLRVNASADALEFITPIVGGVDISCLVFHSVSQSIANNTTAVLTWDSETYDTDGMHDPAVNPTRVTIQTAGKYLVWAYADWLSNANGDREVGILLNGTVAHTIDNRSAAAGRTMQTAIKVMDLVVGDFVESRVFQNSGGALDIVGGTDRTVFGAIKILG